MRQTAVARPGRRLRRLRPLRRLRRRLRRSRLVRRVLPALLPGALLLLPLAAAPAAAQTAVDLTGGLVFVDLTGPDVADAFESTTGVVLGLGLDRRISGRLSLLGGLRWTEKGSRARLFGGAAVFELRYLELPVLLGLSLPFPGPVEPRVFAGPGVAFLLRCDRSTEVDGRTIFSEDCRETMKAVDLGAVVGVDLSFPVMGPLRGLVRGGADVGLTSIDDSGSELEVRNSLLFVDAGVSLMVGR